MFEEGQTGNFSSQISSKSTNQYEKKELVAKSVIALNQVKAIFQCIQDDDLPGSADLNSLIRQLISQNTSHVTFFRNFQQKSVKVIRQLEQIVSEKNVSLLLFADMQSQVFEPFFDIGSQLEHILANIQHSVNWNGPARTSTASFA